MCLHSDVYYHQNNPKVVYTLVGCVKLSVSERRVEIENSLNKEVSRAKWQSDSTKYAECFSIKSDGLDLANNAVE